jgi:uncharacterized protein (TIGR00251 family)
MPPAIEERADGVVLRVRVQPKASREAISGSVDALKVALMAPPVDGEANAALIALIAKRFHLPKSALRLISGEKSREKTVFVPGKTASDAVIALGVQSP